MASVASLDGLLGEELRDIYDAEKQLTKALPKMAKRATAPALRSAFEEHLHQTEEHVERLEQVFDRLDLPARGKKCVGIENIIKEGEQLIAAATDTNTRDAAMIAAAQKAEHYEIAVYGTLRTWANQLGNNDIATILEDTLEDEKGADAKLTGIAEQSVNRAAAEEGEAREARASQPGGTVRTAGGGSVGRGAARLQAADRGSQRRARRATSRSRAKTR